MTRKLCRACPQRHYIYLQAVPLPEKRRMSGLDWTIAVVGGVYFFALAFVVRGWPW